MNLYLRTIVLTRPSCTLPLWYRHLTMAFWRIPMLGSRSSIGTRSQLYSSILISQSALRLAQWTWLLRTQSLLGVNIWLRFLYWSLKSRTRLDTQKSGYICLNSMPPRIIKASQGLVVALKDLKLGQNWTKLQLWYTWGRDRARNERIYTYHSLLTDR